MTEYEYELKTEYESELNFKVMFKSGNGLLRHLKNNGFEAHPAIGKHLVVYPKDSLDLCAIHATVKNFLKNTRS